MKNDFLENKKNSLAHYGVKGMKWGIITEKHRTGNSTSQGSTNKKENDTDSKLSSDSAKDIFTGIKGLSESTAKLFDGKKKEKKFYKKYPDLSDQELAAKLNRLRLEQGYSDLVGDTKVVKTGSEKAKDVLQTVGAIAGIGASIVAITVGISKLKKGA